MTSCRRELFATNCMPARMNCGHCRLAGWRRDGGHVRTPQWPAGGRPNGLPVTQSGTTAVASISTLARSSSRAFTSTAVIAAL